MAEKRIVDIGPLLEELKADSMDYESCCEPLTVGEAVNDEIEELEKLPIIDPETLRPVAHWEEIPGSYNSYIGKNGSWCVPATRCSNPECGEVNPCSLKTPFCPMCGFRMEDVPYERKETY